MDVKFLPIIITIQNKIVVNQYEIVGVIYYFIVNYG